MKRYSLYLGLGSLALVLLAVFSPASWKGPLRHGGLEFLSPLFNTVDHAHLLVTRFRQGLATLETTQKEVSRLREQNEKLATENTVLKDLADENARLREMLGFKKASQYRLLACRMVGRDPSNWWSTVLINRGWADDDKLSADLPVVTARGVVGKTGTVARDVTEVILLVNENCKIAANLENLHEQGIVVGEGDRTGNRPKTRMKFIARNAPLIVGERVFTSGLGGVFPPGLLLGTLVEAPPLSASVNFGLYREAVIDPVVDVSKLDEMFVILGASQ